MPIKIAKLRGARNMALENRWPRKRTLDLDLLKYVEGIIEDVMRRGDSALVDLTMRFDGVRINSEQISVRREEVEEAYGMVSEEQIAAIEDAKSRVENLERMIMSRVGFKYEDEDGVKISREYRPIRSAGCYVPGGLAAYPSTVIMTVAPAKVAGVPRVAVCSPPRKDGKIHPLTLVAADICGADEFYRVGGAQAIAALAYGTETIKPVEKIVGPGNKYVLAAKRIVSRDVPIDHPAGPSEIMILADDSANPYYVALDMLSQAEHGADSIAALVTTSMRLAEDTLSSIMHIIGDLPEGSGVKEALEKNGLILVADSMDEAIDFVNDFAPEHLEIIARGAHEISGKICSSGIILIGHTTPVSLSDYCLGTNHVIPTGGYGLVYQPLSALDFVRCLSIVECSERAMRKLSLSAMVLAKSEGLLNHALALRERLRG
ncbi:MAG: histidinol dehydrogenase [Candidatus Bathyarchaeota archaeon]|nr:histidinol dehydrogenase [Candidatus Bathyarchaeota archaeon]